jgi:hypothetical protein
VALCEAEYKNDHVEVPVAVLVAVSVAERVDVPVFVQLTLAVCDSVCECVCVGDGDVACDGVGVLVDVSDEVTDIVVVNVGDEVGVSDVDGVRVCDTVLNWERVDD